MLYVLLFDQIKKEGKEERKNEHEISTAKLFDFEKIEGTGRSDRRIGHGVQCLTRPPREVAPHAKCPQWSAAARVNTYTVSYRPNYLLFLSVFPEDCIKKI